jgi:probable HAF family extracellular repeat protein
VEKISLRKEITMKRCKSLLAATGVVLTFLMAAAAANAPLTFKFTTVNVPGAIATVLGGINNSGVIVGQYEDTKSVLHCFKRVGSKVTTINHPNAVSDGCIHINSAGAIVGSWKNSAGISTGFLYQNGKFKNIPGPSGAKSSVAYGINDSGQIVGYYADSSGKSHGFLLTGAKYTILNVPGAASTIATGINNAGNIVMYYGIGTRIASALYNGKTYKTINVPLAANSLARDINRTGDIVYEILDSSFAHAEGALFHAGKYYTFTYPKSAATSGFGINDDSVLVGLYQATASGPDQGFKATY